MGFSFIITLYLASTLVGTPARLSCNKPHDFLNDEVDPLEGTLKLEKALSRGHLECFDLKLISLDLEVATNTFFALGNTNAS